MIDFFLVIVILLYFTCIGFVFTKLFFIKEFSFFESLPYDFVIGSSASAVQLYLYSRLNISWNLYIILLPWLMLIGIGIKKKLFNFHKPISVKLTFLDIFFLVLIATLIFFTGFESILRPLSAWDGWATWLFKSKMFFLDGNISFSSLQYATSDYPLLISLIGTYIYIFLGKISDTSVLLYFFFCYIMVGWIVFTYLNRKLSTTKSLLFVFLLFSIQNIIRHGGRYEAGYVDLPLALFILTSSIMLQKIYLQANIQRVVLFNILLSFTALVKNEGFVFSIIAQILLIIILYKKKKMHLFPFSIIWLITIIDWFWFKHVFRLPQNFLLSNLSNHIHFDFITISIAFFKEFLNIKNWNLLWIVYFITCIYTYKKKKNINVFRILTFTQLTLYLVIFFITPIDPVTHIHNIIDRLVMHVAPLALIDIALSYD